MSWTGVVTNAGASLFSRYSQQGMTVNMEKIETGAGAYSSESDMKGATAVQTHKDWGIVDSAKAVTNGVQFRMRVQPVGSGGSVYNLTEIGLFALDGSTSVMVAYFKTDSAISIPLASTFADFMYILTANLALTNDLSFEATVPASALVDQSMFETAMAEKLDADQGIANAGKFMVVGADGVLIPTLASMQGATATTAGKEGLVPAPAAGDQLKFLRADGTWVIPTNTVYTAASDGGLELNGTAFSMKNTGATPGSYGMSADTTGNDGTTISVPYITVDAKGRIISIQNMTYTSKNTTYANMGAASAASAGTAGLVPAPAAGKQDSFLRGDGTWVVPTDTTYTAGTGLSLSNGQFSLSNSGVTAGTYGPSANVTGSNGATISVPQITVDAKGRVTSVTNRTYTSVNTDTNTTYSAGNGLSLSGTTFSMSGSYSGNFTATKVFNAVWNDISECRESEKVAPGYVVQESEDGIMKICSERLAPACRLVSDTFGYCMGETDKAKTPIAIAGRVLAYPHRDISEYHLGDAVCSAPDGKVDIMTREEIREFPERIIGTVSEIPKYEFWIAGDKDNPEEIPVDGRIWVYVR